MLSSCTTCLLVTLLGVLLAQDSNADPICGSKLEKVKVRPLDLKNFDKVKGGWLIAGYYESMPNIFADVQCIHYDYDFHKPNKVTTHKHQIFVNDTKVQMKEELIFDKSDNTVVFHIDVERDYDITIDATLLDYSVNAPCDKDDYLIYYVCVPGKKGQPDTVIFLAKTRDGGSTPIVTSSIDQAIDRVGLDKKDVKEFNNEACSKK